MSFTVTFAAKRDSEREIEPAHLPSGIRFNRGQQCKWGELLETRLAQAKGNQQPSQKYTSGRFRDYWSGEVRLITSQSAPRESDDIVHAHRNVGERVNGLKFNSATLIKSRYAPGTGSGGAGTALGIGTAGTDANKVAVALLSQSTNGAVTTYPTVTGETLWWVNARKPYLNFYVTDDKEYAFGFTGFKPAQGNTKIAGQVLFAGNMTAHPRYHQQLFAITG